MIKLRAGDTLMFGLSDLNLERLKAGKPILIDLRELGFPQGQVVIFHGKTEADMKRELVELIGPDTKYTDSTH
jgi:hypothetical protein